MTFETYLINNHCQSEKVYYLCRRKQFNELIMKTIKTILLVGLWGMLFTMLTASCSDKKTVEKAETAETTDKTESVIKVTPPPFIKFVVVTTEDAVLYKEADTKSPTLVRWDEADCESDFCEIVYQWSDQPDKPGFELSTDVIPWEGRVFPVLGEEDGFYKVCTLNEWCVIESAFLPKDCVGDIESAAIKAEMLEAEDNYFKCRVIKDGKYKDIVLIEEYDELYGETIQVGVLKDGVVIVPLVNRIDSYLDIEQKEDIIIKDTEDQHLTTDGTVDSTDDNFLLRYNKNLAMATEEDEEPHQLDLKKLSDDQVAKIVDTVTSKKPEYVNCMFHFPAAGLEYFYYKAN